MVVTATVEVLLLLTLGFFDGIFFIVDIMVVAFFCLDGVVTAVSAYAIVMIDIASCYGLMLAVCSRCCHFIVIAVFFFCFLLLYSLLLKLLTLPFIIS